MTSYEVLYNSCYGGFDFPDEFIKEAFRRYPPESEEGKKLWKPTNDRFTAPGEPIPKGKFVDRIVKTEEFCHGYHWIWYERINDKGVPDAHQSPKNKPPKYCTKDYTTYYFMGCDYSYEWRTHPGIIALAKEHNIIDTKHRHSVVSIARIPVHYDFRIDEYDGMESVRIVCPTDTIIHDLLQVIRTGNRDNLHILTQKLLDSESYKDILYPKTQS